MYRSPEFPPEVKEALNGLGIDPSKVTNMTQLEQIIWNSLNELAADQGVGYEQLAATLAPLRKCNEGRLPSKT